jgi:hypothetical protein
MSEYLAYNPKTMNIDEYNTLSQELRDIIETYEIVIQSIEDSDKINAKCSCGCTIKTKLISKFLMENICCSSCSQLTQNMDELRLFANKKNGECLSDGKYTGSKSYYMWKCNNCGSGWKSAWYSIKCKGSWCPTCSGSLSENICRHALEEITGYKFAKISNFAKSDTIRGFEIDCYNEELKIGLEYDGIQHSQYTPRFHGAADSGKFEAQQVRDINKNEKCKEMGVNLLRIDHTTSRTELRTHVHALIRGLILEQKLLIELVDPVNFISDIEFDNNVSKVCSEKSSEYMKQIIPIIESKNAILHSTSCDGWKSPIEITCKNNHNFTTNLDNLLRDPPRWCSRCAHNKAVKEEHIREILEPKGYEFIKMYKSSCVSKNDIKNRIRITYKCDIGHIVDVLWDNHSNNYKQCPDCVNDESKQIAIENANIREVNREPTKKEKEHDYALSLGYNIGDYNNAVNDLTKICCITHNHVFYANPHTLLKSENCNKEHCSQCILQDNFPNLEVSYTNLAFNGSDCMIPTRCIECGEISTITNKSIQERVQCCKNLKCKYRDTDKHYILKRSRNKYENRYNGHIFRTIEDMDQVIADSELIHNNQQQEVLRLKQSTYQNHPDYIIPIWTSKFVVIEFKCRKYHHKFKSKITTLDSFPERELCAQCIIRDDYPYHQLDKDFDFMDNDIESKRLYLICKCGKKSDIVHKALRVKTTKFCTWKKCTYYNQYNPIRNVDKSKNIPKVVAI